MIEAERVKLEKTILGSPETVECPILYDTLPDGTRRTLDGWIIPVVERTRVVEARNALLIPQNYFTQHGDSTEPIHPAELSPLIANVHGVLLLRTSRSETLDSPLVSTPTTTRALRSLALHLSLSTPTLLTSPPSSGKSLLLSHLAGSVHPDARNQIVTIHLADTSLDPRSLLGSYVSSPTRPGTFDWKEGVLVRAMREGKWVVFEDADRGSTEVLGLIRPLLEFLGASKWVGARAALEVPGRGRVEAAESFAVFATRSLLPSRSGKYPPPTFFGSHLFQEVIVDPPTHEDLRLIIATRFPRLAGPLSEGLINLWEAVRDLGSTASTRDVGMRELERLCLRVGRVLPSSFSSMAMDVDSSHDMSSALVALFPNSVIREDIFAECRDVFFGAGATTAAARQHLDLISATIAEQLGLSAERRDWVLRGRIPELSIDKDVNGSVTSVRVGNTRLLPSSTPEHSLPVTRPFAMHKPAISLLSRIATAISLNEPILLTGETGTGKTSVVTHLASLLRKPLISLNLSNQTESSDIVGGFKPVDARVPASELQGRFSDLFGGTFSRKKNAHFEESVRKAVHEGKWKRAVTLWKESVRLARDRIQAKASADGEVDAPRKRRKTDAGGLNVSEARWIEFERDVTIFEIQHVQGNGKFAYGFVEGPLVKALRAGHWILLDEVNLASAETLECVSSLLHGPTASITLTEQGSLEPIPRHPDFRLFACMNPATDVGKKDLPPNIRSRFTEFDVPPPDADKETLLSIVAQYIGPYAVGDRGAIMDVAEFYTAVRTLAERREIADGSNHRPHFSMRTLARALTFAADLAASYSLRRALWEGCLMAFTMILDKQGAAVVTALAQKHILSSVKNPRSLLSMVPGIPQGRSADEVVKFGPFYLDRGPLPEDPAEEFIMTPSVEAKLIDLARIIVTKRFPVLIEGPTSSGKTSSIEYLARRTGHRFVRINNHEHTDIQEYLGTYVSDPATGKLVFKDGLLVRALRNGDWIVLDELNLAPTDVLEALNRLLDDNRELVIPETQEVVRPHPHFMLFATQNPPGLYAGRKVLSRAFRNRFLEVHFEDVPQAELETILCQRCRIAPSYASRIVAVFQELQRRRQSSRIFESKHGFATLRDLFRWAGRDAISYQELAENGYMLLAERARRDDDKIVVKEVLESIMKVTIDPSQLYSLHGETDMASYLGCLVPKETHLVWTSAMQRLFTLVARALRFNEPVLLVGETGCGKTSVCQLFAEITGRALFAVNCHQNTETADLIGGLRPLRNRAALEADALQEAKTVLAALEHPLAESAGLSEALAAVDSLLRDATVTATDRQSLMQVKASFNRLSTMFEWHDGPLVEAMRTGGVFLMDEISLADDSVLERLNSVLETGRTIVLAEKGGAQDLPAVVADDSFKLVATMNPGGDYGKKELSPALRNRFTEIWVPSVDARSDLELIVRSMWRHEALKDYTPSLLDFTEWLSSRVGDTSVTSLRDILAWVQFSNAVYNAENPDVLPGSAVFHHAAFMTFLDGLGSLPQLSSYSPAALEKLKADASVKLQELVPLPLGYSDEAMELDPAYVRLGSFTVPKGPKDVNPDQFSFQAPTTRDNVNRVVRACQLNKPILLEGSPGVGKTSLVAALANICGYHLCRINLSDQTDLIDLFGSDLPVEGGSPGQFAWKDAEFLRALQEGHWVLLDEMNLAPQAVLEGLNAVLDHRGTVYIPELGRSFQRHPSFRIFAAQNPLHQGGGRKGLPKSFLNRFTKVYVQELSGNDVQLVCRNLFPSIPEDWMHGMIAYITRLQEEVTVKRSFGREGAPWEFNLRDVIRWASQIQQPGQTLVHPVEFINTLFLQRFRTTSDRQAALHLFRSVFTDADYALDELPYLTTSPSFVKIGRFINERSGSVLAKPSGVILQGQLSALESLGASVANGWLSILTGPRGSGKTSLIRLVADLMGKNLQEISVNNATDASDILGSFEEVDSRVRVQKLLQVMQQQLNEMSASSHGSKIMGTRQLSRSVSILLNALCHNVEMPNIVAAASDLQELLSATDDVPLPNKEQMTKILGAILSSQDAPGRFEWVDGPLVRALKDGSWVLLDGANLCNPSVLDRLNSLCENNGRLTLNERGAVSGEVEVIAPHPNFRLFMCVDNQYGELSRAMRNRGVEISLLPLDKGEDGLRLLDFWSLPTGYTDSLAELPTLPLRFNATRRGIWQEAAPGTGESIPSGRTAVSDTTASSILDLLPAFRSPIQSHAHVHALALFAIYSVAPGHLHVTVKMLREAARSLPHLNDVLPAIENIPTSHLLAAVCHARELMSASEGIPQEILLVQPINPLSTVDIRHSSADAVLALLKLFVSVHLHGLGSSPRSTVQHNGSNTTQRRVVEEVYALQSAVLGVAQNLMSSVNLSDPETQTSAALADKLLGFAKYLRDVVCREPFDYSALHVVSQWLSQSIDTAPNNFTAVTTHVRALSEILALSSGTGLAEIWSGLTHRVSGSLDLDKISRLDATASRLPLGMNGRRQDIFQLIALLALPMPLDEENKDVLDALVSKLEEWAPDVWSAEVDHSVAAINPSYLTLQLSLLSSINFGSTIAVPSGFAERIRTLLRLAVDDVTIPLSAFVQLQHGLWAHDAGTLSFAHMIDMQRGWLDGVWATSCSADLQGPSSLLGPAVLYSTVMQCAQSEQTLEQFEAYQEGLLRQSRLVAMNAQGSSSRTTQLLVLLAQCIIMVCGCFQGTYEADEFATALSMAAYLSDQDVSISLPPIMDRLARTRHVGLRSAIQDYLLPSLSKFQHGQQVQARHLVLGESWIAFGRFLVHLFVPNTPIDPAGLKRCSDEYWTRERAIIEAQLDLHRSFSRRTHGNESNDTTRHLESILSAIQAVDSNVSPSRTRDDIARLHVFWSEVHQFMSQVLSPQKLASYVSIAISGNAAAPMREQVMQKSLLTFNQRLRSAYPDFADINAPLQQALLAIRFGLRILTHAGHNSVSTDNPETSLYAALLAFPSVRSAERLCALSSATSTPNTTFPLVLARLSAISYDVQQSGNVEGHLPDIEHIYEQALGLWLIDQARAEEAERQAQSLYRRKDDGNLNEAEEEEEEFLSIFPEFEDTLDDDRDESPQTKPKRKALVDSSAASSLFSLHQELFLPAYSRVTLAAKRFMDERRALVTAMLESQVATWSDDIDSASFPFQARLLHDHLVALGRASADYGRPYDFYFDQNVPETKKAVDILRALMQRLEAVIREWPEQMVLQHLRSRCEIVMNFSLHSPLAKTLSALEQLLSNIDDWEMYANRNNSLKAHQQSIISLVVAWRRLELASWQGLLDSQARAFEAGTSEWWFRLYDASIRGVLKLIENSDVDATNTDAVSEFLDNLVPLLDEFMSSSTLGQFTPRLRLVDSMQGYASKLADQLGGARGAALQRVHMILCNTATFYDQFEGKIVKSLSEQRKVLEKDIRDFIKLASWKDVNIHALKQSAQRTHRQLYKVIRKFRDLLRQPALPLLQPGTSEVVDNSSVDGLGPSSIAPVAEAAPVSIFPATSDSSQPAHILHIDRTFRNFDLLIADRLVSFMQAHSADAVEDFAMDIISTSKALANEAIPTNLPADRRTKLGKNLLNRKRKAWSDLLKELKRAGLSANVKPEILQQNQSKRHLREQPIMKSSRKSLTVLKGEEYLHRVSGLLPQLRLTLSNHHPDLSTRELQRAVMFVEHSFFFCMQTRTSLTEIISDYEALNSVFQRLRTIRARPEVCCSGLDALRMVLATVETCHKVSDALKELLEHLQDMQADIPDTDIPDELLEELPTLRAALAPVSGALEELATTLQSSGYPLVLKGEYDLLVLAMQHLAKIKGCLRQWSTDTTPLLSHFTRPVAAWLDEKTISIPDFAKDPNPAAPREVIDSLLLSVQSMLAIRNSLQEEQDEERDNYIRDDSRLTCRLSEKLGVGAVLRDIDALLQYLAHVDPEQVQTTLARILPFLERYLALVDAQVHNHAGWSKALFKLNFTLCSIVGRLAKDGFCQPQDTEGAEEGGEGQETMEGTGLGDGSGSENVSKEIQDESQVEGLQGEDGEAEEKVERAEEGNAIEMSEDFSGEMQDVPEADDEGEGEEEEGSDADPDEQIGDVDPTDENAVDEKLWGDEQGPEDKDDSGKTNQDHSKQQTGESEMVGKEGEQSKSEKKDDAQKDEAQGEGDENQEQTMEEEGEAPLPDEEPAGAEGAPMDEHVQEADTLDLPENMEMEQDAQEQDASGDVDDDLMDEDVDDENVDPGKDEQADKDDEMGEDDQVGQPQAMQEDSAQPDGTTEDVENDAVAQADTHAGDGRGAGEEAQPTEPSGAQPENSDDAEDSSKGQQGPSAGASEEQAQGAEDAEKSQEEKDDAETEAAARNDAAPSSAPQNASGNDTSGTRSVPQGEAQQQQQLANNPLRSLGDALREISQRFNEILESNPESTEQKPGMDDAKPAQVEHVQNDDTQEDMQALGPARQDEVAKLRELNLADDEQAPVDPAAMDIDVEMPDETLQDQLEHGALSSLKAEQTAEAMDSTVKSILTASDVIKSGAEGDADMPQAPIADLVPKEEEDEEDSKLELEVRDWQARGQPSDEAEHIWRRYESLTHDLSYALCEQLRLILEPTQATRLRGDYRTGKRLNMKKIIPYIASEYTKDKIWLRRTRPSTREYQVLLALDDSRSMAESHSVHLAFQTLALVARALGRLEVGDVAIARFGAAVDVLHGFEAGPFTDQAGARVVDAFRFDQKATNVLGLLESSLTLLEQARERRSASSSTAADLWQMEIIISDGVCQDHERLRTILRRAEEQRVMVVFIILDSLHSNTTTTATSNAHQNSIVSMNQVAYKDVNGRMELSVSRYLDTFPFEYYVVVRDVEALPEVLSGTLKQFFERISEE
ncbi:midasin [Phanerochaete sordida]|uniref:Midasin n=1 Tax=Phanerochaete sordida TaxID=48140 RepID=A0A9P3G3L7_9APHY|nr:midasin [Phanerochaete sordida]